MSRATVLTTAPSLQTSFRRVLSILGIAPFLIFAACSSGGDSGGGTTPGNNAGAGNQFAYVIDSGSNQIQAYHADGSGNMTTIGNPIATGVFPHHVDVDPSSRFVYVSNHDSTFLSGWRINPDGSLAAMNAAAGSPVTGGDPTENEPHSSVVDQTSQFLYVVAGTGASTLRAYKLDNTGMPTFIAGQSFPVGTHAHNVTISPNNQFLYVACEDSNEVRAFSRNTSTGALTAAGTVPGLLGATAVRVDPQNKFLYAAHVNAVDVFAIQNDGSLKVPGSTFSTNNNGTGSGPHSMVMHPNGQTLYTANLNSATIGVFHVDASTGALTEIQVPNPKTGTDPNYIVVHPNQQFVFTADAVSNQLSRFTINADGTLAANGVIPDGLGANGIAMTNF